MELYNPPTPQPLRFSEEELKTHASYMSNLASDLYCRFHTGNQVLTVPLPVLEIW